MTALQSDWPEYAQRLADSLLEHGDVSSPEWHAALAAVPRHVFVPYAYEQDSTGRWTAFNTADVLERVYSPETLITAVARVDGEEVPISSSTKPDLMLRMLEILDIRPGHRVLEVGTGTGYNAALLAHRLGGEQVFSIEIDPDLVELARERLAVAGYRPILATGDGAAGLPEHAPFDRIIATCSVPAVPWAWAEQLSPGGAILVDLKLAVSAGNLVHLRRAGDRLEGRFTHRWAGFMAMRHEGQSATAPGAERATDVRRRSTKAPARPWDDVPVVWFLAQIHLPRGVITWLDIEPESCRPTAATLEAPDGSWARVRICDGDLTEAGPTRLWASVERAYEWWMAADRPSWERLGLTVKPDGSHRVWLDNPDYESQWVWPGKAHRQR